MRKSGFTLIEVIVAMAILGISLAMVMQLFSAGLKAARASCDYTRAVVHAKEKMEELVHTLRNDSGEFEDGFKWESEIDDYIKPETDDSKKDEETNYNLMKLKVIISWPDVQKIQKSIELVSLKMVTDEDKL